MYNIGIFISHSWAYTEHYSKLEEWIFKTEWNVESIPIRFIDYSIPESNPIHNAPNQTVLARAIYTEIAKSNVVICPTGMYSSYSNWISKELDAAHKLGKKILAVNPWGQERKSSVVQKNANYSVGWTRDGVVNAVWKLYNL